MIWVECLGFAGSFSVIAGFCMTEIVSLRAFALLSNVFFILYGLFDQVYPVLCLHAVLLPINLTKLYRLHFKAASRTSVSE